MKEYDVSEIETNFYDESGNKKNIKVVTIFKIEKYQKNYALCAEFIDDTRINTYVFSISKNENDEFVFEDITEPSEKDLAEEISRKLVA